MNRLEARIRSATRATAEDITPGSIPPLDLPAQATPARPRPDRGGRGRRAHVLVPLAAAASVVAVVALSLAVTGPHRGPAGAPTAGRWPAAAFRYVGPGAKTQSLTCVTASVCYNWTISRAGRGSVRTADGGATWQPVAPWPGDLGVLQGVSPSCPTPEVCVAWVGGLTLAVTTNGGGSWRTETLPRPVGASGVSVDQVSCATADRCVVHLTEHGPGTFLATDDGGRSWTPAARVPAGAPKNLWLLRCDASGHCIGVYPTDPRPTAALVILRSADNGRTWALSSTPAPPSALAWMSCADGQYCMYVGDSGATMTTSDGGVTWQHQAAAATSPEMAASLSCPAAGVCYLAFVENGREDFVNPVIEATRDGGRTWTRLAVPTAGGSPLVVVDPLSCPTPAGCIAVAGTAAQYSGNPTGQAMIISNLTRAGN